MSEFKVLVVGGEIIISCIIRNKLEASSKATL